MANSEEEVYFGEMLSLLRRIIMVLQKQGLWMDAAAELPVVANSPRVLDADTFANKILMEGTRKNVSNSIAFYIKLKIHHRFMLCLQVY